MHLSRMFAVPAAAGILVLTSVSPALAGEVTGTGEVTGAYTKSNSECAFSGLEDGSEGGPGGPGVAPQNWGQIPQADRAFLTSIGVNPGKACNGHLYGRK